VIIDQALPVLRAEVGVVALLSEDGQNLRNIGFKGVDEATQADWQEYPVTAPVPVADAARTRSIVLVRTLAERNERYPVLASVHGLEHGGPVVALPLFVNDELRGVLAFCWAFPLPLEEDQLSFLRTLADQCALAVERARLYELAEREIAERKASEILLREASARRDEFLAMLAHELRNPMAPIAAAAELLQGVDGSQVASARTIIQRQVTHLRRLVDDLLDAARAVQARLTLQPSTIDLGDVVRTTALDQAEAFAQAGIALDLRVPGEPIWTHADGMRLAQAIANLLHNARKFSPPQTRVSIELKRSGPEQALIEIRDEGSGIEPELLPLLFEPFAQSDRSLDRSKGGLGLGLSIARAIARLHGGDVSVDSAGAGHGARFVLSVGLTPVVEAVPPAPAAWPDSGSKRILVVEDNQDAAEMMLLLLESFGHEVRLAYDAEAALDLLDDWNAQVILSDIGLPDVDGFALARRIRARGNPTFRPLLVAISGYGREIDRNRAREAGFDHYLTKPVDSRALVELLANAQQ
jgi:signal transduction histidine kinase/CheY-like chemotaxis protein